MILVLSSMVAQHRLVRADQAVERAAGIAVDERKAAGEHVAHVHDVRFAEADHDVGLGVRVRQVRELEVVIVEMQRRRVGERDHRQRFARARCDGRVGGRIHLRGAEPLAHVFLRDDHRARLAEGVVAAGVIAVQVRVDHELHRLVAEHGDRGADFRRHVGELVVDDGGAIDAHRETHVAAAADEHVDARCQADGFDLHVRAAPASRAAEWRRRHLRVRAREPAAATRDREQNLLSWLHVGSSL